jgi:hypothetical protein
MPPTLGSSHPNAGEQGTNIEYGDNTASSSATQQASEKDADQANVTEEESTNDSVSIDANKTTMTIGNSSGGSHSSTIDDEATPTATSQQSSTLDSARVHDNAKIWKLVVVSMVMGTLIIIAAATGLVLYRTLKDESNEQHFKYDAAAPLVQVID